MKGITPNPMSHLVPLLEFNHALKLRSLAIAAGDLFPEDLLATDFLQRSKL
jgi:hypothetical protein